MSDSATGASNVGAILDAYLRALEEGRAPPREELLAQHPQCAAELAAALDGLEFIHLASREIPRGVKEGDALAERQLLGDFRLVREVGRGGMAVVYEAEQVSLGRRVALKVLPFAAVLDPKQLQRFKNEALSAAHLRHPHIVPVYSVGCERGVHYYAMQLIEGQSLATVIREMRGQAPAPATGSKTPITSHGSNRAPGYVRMAVALGMQAAEALDHAHQLGIVHRDIKPGNLLVDGLGELWITDFGLARSMRDGDLTMTGELLGTYRYMSPEQTLAKRAAMDHRTDVYSLGATLYELLTLEPAFPGDDPHLVMRDIAEKEPVAPRRLNPALPVDLETIVLKAMSKDATGRYATAQEMAEDLGRYLADQPIRARRPSLAARASKWTRRHRGFVTAAFVVLLLGVVALAADNVRVGAEEKKTKAALDRANGNLLLARSAVDKFLVEIGVTNMADQPVPKPGKRRMLETALRFHERNFDDHDSIGTRVTILHSLHRYDDAIGLLDALIVRASADAWAHMQRGHMLWHRKRYDDALAALDVACTNAPDLPEAHSFKGCVLKDVGRLRDALAEHDRALECVEHEKEVESAKHDSAVEIGPRAAPFHDYRADTLIALGKPQAALAAYEQACKLDPNLVNCLVGKGEALAELGRPDDALAAYDRAIAVDPNYAWAFTGRGIVLQSLRRLDEAVKSHDRALEIDPDVSRALVNRGIVLRELGRLDDAIADYRRAIELEPTLAQAHEDLGIALALAGHLDEALKEAEEGLGLAPNDAHAHFNLGCVYTQRREFGAAIRACKKAIDLQHDLQPAYVNLASALVSFGDLDEAIRTARIAVDMKKDDAEALGGLGNALRAKGDFEGALAAYGEVIRIRPDYAVGRHCLGQVLARCGKHRDAIESFKVAARLDAKFAEPHYEAGLSLLALRDPDSALAEFDAALKVRPEYADACRMSGRAFAMKGDLAGEIRAYEAAVAIRSDYVEALTELGRARNDRGDHDGAIEALSRALALRSDLPEAHLNLGNAYTDKNDLDRGIAEFRTAIELLSHCVPADPAKRDDHEQHDATILSLSYNSLGCALDDKKERDPAIAAYRDSIRVDPNCAPAHYNLGKALYGMRGHDEECEAEYREAIRIEGDMAEAFVGLGRLFMAQNRFREALPPLTKGHEIELRRKRWNRHVPDWIATCEKKIALEDHLDDVASGKAAPTDELERTEVALLLYKRKRYREAEQFFEKALASDAKLADDLEKAHRYNAACTAVLAAADGVPDAAALRARALQWLRADLAARQKSGLGDSLANWKGDADFKSVRDDVGALPAPEREAWTKLWSDVDASIAPQH